MSLDKFSKKQLISIIESLISEVRDLKSQVISLTTKVSSLEEQKQILNIKKTSSNSSMPPSGDLTRSNQSLRPPSDRKKGGQIGHEGHTLEMSSKPDKIVRHTADFCFQCGHNLSDVSAKLVERRQVIDIPPIIPIYIEHQSFSKVCVCGCVCKGEFPQNINAPIQYGQSIESLAAYFSVRQYMPYQRMKECFSDVFGIKISQSSLVNSIGRFAQKAMPIYQRIKNNINSSQVIATDETGIKVNNKKGWFWTWQNELNTFISFSYSRGFDTITSVFPNGFKNKIIVSDCLAAQLKVDSQAHQICLAHLMRELNYFIETTADNWALELKKLLKDAIELKKQIIDYEIPIPERQEIEKRLTQLLEIKELSKNKKQKAFQKRLQKHKNKILPFLYSKNVPPDNNGSERALRNVKVKEKISGQFVSEQKAKDFAVIRSVIDTIIKNKSHIFDSLKLITQI